MKFQRETDNTKSIQKFKKIMKTRGIEVTKPKVIRRNRF